MTAKALIRYSVVKRDSDVQAFLQPLRTLLVERIVSSMNTCILDGFNVNRDVGCSAAHERR